MKANKTQILIAHQKEDIDRTQKSKASRQKKVQLGFRGFCPYFLLLTTPYVMFESKETQILIAHQKEDIDGTQKSTASRQKKDSLCLEDFAHIFCC